MWMKGLLRSPMGVFVGIMAALQPYGIKSLGMWVWMQWLLRIAPPWESLRYNNCFIAGSSEVMGVDVMATS